MADPMQTREMVVEATADDAAAAVAARFKRIVCDAIAERGICSVALAGGTTPRGLYGILARTGTSGEIPLDAWIPAAFPPVDLDTDDDTITDETELKNGWRAQNSISPFNPTFLRFNWEGRVAFPREVEGVTDSDRRFSSREWTVEAWVRPDTLPSKTDKATTAEDSDGLDSDGDGVPDDGPGHPAGSPEEDWGNGVDDDGDGVVDDTQEDPAGSPEVDFNGDFNLVEYRLTGTDLNNYALGIRAEDDRPYVRFDPDPNTTVTGRFEAVSPEALQEYGIEPANTRWLHLAGVFDGQQLNLYINGMLKTTLNVSVEAATGPG